jgi:hypothetical protein
VLPFSSDKSSRGSSIELSIRLWARNNADAAEVIEEVDQLRLTYTSSLLVQLGFDDSEAEIRAFLIYAFILAEDTVSKPNIENLRQRCESFLTNYEAS